MKLNKKPAYTLPEYENEDQYDMQERSAIDIDELKKRSELYDEEDLDQDIISNSKPTPTPTSSKYDNESEYDMKERLAIDAAESAERAKNYRSEGSSEKNISPMQRAILEARLKESMSKGEPVMDASGTTLSDEEMKLLGAQLNVGKAADMDKQMRFSKMQKLLKGK